MWLKYEYLSYGYFYYASPNIIVGVVYSVWTRSFICDHFAPTDPIHTCCMDFAQIRTFYVRNLHCFHQVLGINFVIVN